MGVAIGYQNNPALSATVFDPDPFIPGGMMYKTGDYARLLDDGCVDCFGRKDGQIKINGQRIETGEIQQRLLECSGIIEAVVVPYRVRETLHIAAVVSVRVTAMMRWKFEGNWLTDCRHSLFRNPWWW
ncbi:AMP-binding protein [Escherichia coli]|uniref:AMP-binding protein n=1 Tax=Escherichia coli TaxID=562 RepID=UPI0023080151|nr:AMP-binding protein [Escherichia coli]WCE59810.1 AMP-binding protein [Escherichia coli]